MRVTILLLVLVTVALAVPVPDPGLGGGIFEQKLDVLLKEKEKGQHLKSKLTQPPKEDCEPPKKLKLPKKHKPKKSKLIPKYSKEDCDYATIEPVTQPPEDCEPMPTPDGCDTATIEPDDCDYDTPITPPPEDCEDGSNDALDDEDC